MHLRSRLWVSALSLSFVLSGQTSPATPDNGPATFTADTRLVLLPVSVADKSGKLITNLPRQAFKVYENGAEQLIKVFRREDVPISLGIIIDNSGSMRDKR